MAAMLLHKARYSDGETRVITNGRSLSYGQQSNNDSMLPVSPAVFKLGDPMVAKV